jgi:uroporphyrinogen decarboxylase
MTSTTAPPSPPPPSPPPPSPPPPALTPRERVQRAFRCEAVDRPPVWFMRQAGRYLPEYRALRAEVSFEALCQNAELSCEVTLQPLARFPLDIAIVFSDILTVPEAMGLEVVFDTGHGPELSPVVRTRDDIARLRHPDVAETLKVVPETLRLFRQARPDIPIFGFAGAPFTLFCYMVEGRGGKDWRNAKQLLWREPALASQLLGRIADTVGDYLQLQIDSGAEAVQMFDTWAGVLSIDDYRRFALPAAQRALSRVKGAPRLYFMRDAAAVLHELAGVGADAFALDWCVDMAQARKVLGDRALQGNLDPIALFAPEDVLRAKVRAIIDAAGPRGHIFNLGHGVVPETPIAGVEVMIDEVQRSALR